MTDHRPNIVVLYADDLGWGDLGCFGAADIPTPHLDSLRTNGVKLSQWYANSPVCSPSRASLLTGKYPAHAGVESILGGRRGTPGLPPQPTLSSLLRDRGYATGLFGKWHLGTDPAFAPGRYGFDEVFGIRAGCVDYYSHIFYWGGRNPVHDLWDGEDEIWLNGEYLTTVIGRRAAEFITREASRGPFFCYVPFTAPHYPMHAPAEHMDRVAHLPPGRREMAAMIAALDDAVGEILAALTAAGARENTLVVFSSDNGPSRESRNWLDGEEISYTGGSAGGLRGSKGSVFEGGIRVPGIASWPAGMPAGTEFDEPGMMMDLLPTILHAADGTAPDLPDVDGISLLEALRGDASPAQRSLMWTYQGQWAVRRGHYKLVTEAREGMDPPATLERAVIDLDADVAERRDVTAEVPQAATELERDLDRWRDAHQVWTSAAMF
ncbi:sulfatase-like hydrolase/transferase [Brachybacterium sp. FME24]|uniref:sulfatase-like hydrolase/transferase n=1 Tax=Brachybacterium sp. FME24 TaxID=2742605 RepID=UPI0018671B78|nr:sulfatase-like hydrolase/transferase [Brachybacterium sp. FME24]